MAKEWQIRFVGIGGQGNVLAAQLIGHAAVLSGFNACQSSMYSAQVRGAVTRGDVIISDGEIYDIKVTDPFALVVMSEKAYKEYKWQKTVHLLAEEHIKVDEKNYSKLHVIPAIRMAEELGNVGVQNMIFAGYVIGLIQEIPIENLERAIEERVSKKYVEIDKKAARLGYQLFIDEKEV